MERGKVSAKKHGIVLGMAVLGAFMTGLNIGLAADEISKSEHWRTAYAAAARGDWRGVLKALMGAPDGHFLGEHLFGDFASHGCVGLLDRIDRGAWTDRAIQQPDLIHRGQDAAHSGIDGG